MTQSETILKHLRRRTITKLQAAKLYSIFHLPDCVYQLRQKGHKVRTTLVQHGSTRFARYSL